MFTATSKNVLFYELCRLCLENAGARDVFDTNDLLEDIFACTGVKVSPSDNLPHKVCMKCFDVVTSSKELRLLALKNDAHLRVLFGGVQDSGDLESDINQSYAHPTCETPSKPEMDSPDVKSTYFENSNNSLNSSKKKLSLLLDSGEENSNQMIPVIKQTISLRKDLFPTSPAASPHKRQSQTQEEPHHRLLKVKVEAEKHCKRIKFDDNDEIDYVCTICHKEFDKYKKFYLHQRLHNKRICCPLDACGKKFATKGDLEKHVRTHTGEKPFLCNICERRFTQRVSLRTHVTTVHSADVKAPKDEESEADSHVADKIQC